ncbi:hypothetical protein [Salinispira pacifica]|uniref:Uncharacterized protein n=1 Tax=Salinispira pacifica TaxID=1307761 RepID=V5WFB6_9SPIO|nr:hypothetical protein [Salinispira pacifica]AHC13871.1 hypothetical protein L21SP2_0439 [Salinispira pacifica]
MNVYFLRRNSSRRGGGRGRAGRFWVLAALVLLQFSCSAPPFFPGLSNAAKLISRMDPGGGIVIQDIPRWQIDEIGDRSPIRISPPALTGPDMLDTGMYLFFPRGDQPAGKYLFFDARDPEFSSDTQDYLTVTKTLTDINLIFDDMVSNGYYFDYLGIDLYEQDLERWPAGMYPIGSQDGGQGILKVELDGASMNLQAQTPVDTAFESFKATETAALWDNGTAASFLSSDPQYSSEGFSSFTEDYRVLGFSPPYQSSNAADSSRLSYLVFHWPTETAYEIALDYQLQFDQTSPAGTIAMSDPAVHGIIRLPRDDDGRPDERYSPVGFYHRRSNQDSPRSYFSVVDRNISEFITFTWDSSDPGLTERTAEKLLRNGEPVRGRLLNVLHDGTLVFNSQGVLSFYGESDGRWADLNAGSLKFLGERYDSDGEEWRVFFRYELTAEQDSSSNTDEESLFMLEQRLYSIPTAGLYEEIGY